MFLFSFGAVVEGPFDCPTPTPTTLVMDRFTLTQFPEKSSVSNATTQGLPESMIAPGRSAYLGVPMEVFRERNATQLEALASRFRSFAQPLSALPTAAEALAAQPPAHCELGEDGSGVVLASLETWRWIASAPPAPTRPPPVRPADGPEALALVKALSTGQADDLARATRLQLRQRSVIAVVGVSRALPDDVSGVELSGVVGAGVLWLVSAASRAPPCYRRSLKLKQETSRQYQARTYQRYARLREQELARTLELLLPWPSGRSGAKRPHSWQRASVAVYSVSVRPGGARSAVYAFRTSVDGQTGTRLRRARPFLRSAPEICRRARQALVDRTGRTRSSSR